MARENAEAFLKATNAEVEALRVDIKILRESDVKNDAMLLIQARVAFITTLSKTLAREREVYKSTIGANTEQTRQLHLLLVKLTKEKYIDNITLKILENQQTRNTHLVNRQKKIESPTVTLCPQMVVYCANRMDGVDVHDQLRLHQYSIQKCINLKNYYRQLRLGISDMTLK
ncbi:hypothetical protein PInf_026470 [Phytophthora infestans]|nr:hypothetical protein PInf_026470 [Phytophthora infestans]